MKQREFITLALLLFAVLAFSSELSLRVVPIQGAAVGKALSSIGKVVYKSDSMLVYDHLGGMLYSESLHNIGYVQLAEEHNTPTAAISADEKYAQLMVYPNPTKNILQVCNAIGKQVRIYDANGKLLSLMPLREGNAMLDVSFLPSGNYVLVVENGAFHIIKE